MDIVFGLFADAGGWPEHGGDGPGALGAPVVGPSGLLEILETARGLGAPRAPAVVRIAAFQAALEAMKGSRFWNRSLDVDGWATARTLLRWRDELIDIGWTNQATWTNGRLADLACAEAAAAQVPGGVADRVVALNANLQSKPRLPVRRIRLIDQRDVHSAGWRRLLDNMERCGVVIEQLGVVPAAPEGSALGKLQRWMLAGGGVTGEPDGTLTIATSASAALAAEVAGHWFAEREIADAVLIAQDSDTNLLDHGLCGAGQPRAGRSRASAHRGSLQVLLLAFKVTWAPFDPRALMELLVFPTSPLPPRAARRLAAALEQAPGRGGPEWQAAWLAIEEAEQAEASGDATKLRKAQARLERWRSWAEPQLADPEEGMPLQDALAVCDRTISWAVARHALNGEALYQATATLANEVRAALIVLGRSYLPRTLIERIIDQALDVGHDNPLASAEAARWRCVPHPGAVWGPTSTIIWWNFRTTQEGVQRQPWTQTERAELASRGCPPDDATKLGTAASAAWERAVMNARDHLLLIAGGLDAGNDEALHPLAHRMAPVTERLATCVRLEDALARDRIVLSGVELRREAIAVQPLPEPRTLWTTPTNFSGRLADLPQSATSFENLLACQLMWALKHVAKLRPGRVRSIPDPSQLLGNLAHALAQEIFEPGPPPTPDIAAQRTRDLLEMLVSQLAAPLRLPELAVHLADAQERLPLAMAHLASILAENGLVVEATELQVSGTFEDALAVRGAVDLVARDQQGHHVIIDLKWTKTEKRRLQELKDGAAVQLATYGALVAGEAPYRAGYYLLNKRQFATLRDSGLIGRTVEAKRGFPATWQAVLESWRRLSRLAEEGGLIATGVEGCEEHLPEDLPLVREVNCQWCDYQTLCRVRGLK